MAQQCVHRGCGKHFLDSSEPCTYHPGLPVFHEGQKGYRCCKPRVLTFDEFLTLPPCTTGTHSIVDDTLQPEPDINKLTPEQVDAKIAAQNAKASAEPAVARQAVSTQQAATPTPKAEVVEEVESDEEDVALPSGARCKRKGCGQSYDAKVPRGEEKCVHHPGAALFHEGSKGWTCCKRRVLEFDEFMKIEGCTTKARHVFVGKPKTGGNEEDEEIKEVRSDFYQTASTVIASLYLKKVDKTTSSINFKADKKTVALDLRTSDRKRYCVNMELFATIDPEKSSFKIMGTKVELTLVKGQSVGWSVLRSGDRGTGEIIQAGRAGRV
ncbi:hypothetical protein B0A48_08115 [Cryoendolithus antarcticus]|uniref:Uncharacterized protein n=1 Tax=Cryoendolithus antarcticus TaxID=1507870 RepID=A0A1V8T0Z3_9PEZI|nr:hypothetical protein B0A48_08115 [Cryoendolithus antarcticus]